MDRQEAKNGYAIEHQGKPPEFVLEVASPTTGTRDYTIKRDGYVSFGISEYWRADPSGGEWYDAALANSKSGFGACKGRALDTGEHR